MINHQNRLIPVISFCQLLQRARHGSTVSARIIAANATPAPTPPFGLIAETVTKTLNHNDALPITNCTHVSQNPYVDQL
ncbi:MAG: hypothetical protein ACFB0E_19835 [Leptolyngbyaceae cyanobacterium]